MLTATTNAPYPNRLQLMLGDWIGPFIQPASPPVEFDPTNPKHLEVYVDGLPLAIINASYDPVNNRYLLFADKAFNLQGVIQLIHHMPSPPFQYGQGVFLSQRFRYVASYYNPADGSIVPPTTLIQDSGASSPVYSVRTPDHDISWSQNAGFTWNFLSPNGRWYGQIFYREDLVSPGDPSPVIFRLWDLNTLSGTGPDPLLPGYTLATMTEVTTYTTSSNAVSVIGGVGVWIPVSEPFVDNNGTMWYVTQAGSTISLYSLAVGVVSPTLVSSFTSAGSPWDYIFSACVVDPTNQIVGAPTNYSGTAYGSVNLLTFGSNTPLYSAAPVGTSNSIVPDYVQPSSSGGNNLVYLQASTSGTVAIESGGAVTGTRAFPYPNPSVGITTGNNSCPYFIGGKWYMSAAGIMGGTDAGTIELLDDGTTLTLAASPVYVDTLPAVNLTTITGYIDWFAPLG